MRIMFQALNFFSCSKWKILFPNHSFLWVSGASKFCVILNSDKMESSLKFSIRIAGTQWAMIRYSFLSRNRCTTNTAIEHLWLQITRLSSSSLKSNIVMMQQKHTGQENPNVLKKQMRARVQLTHFKWI